MCQQQLAFIFLPFASTLALFASPSPSSIFRFVHGPPTPSTLPHFPLSLGPLLIVFFWDTHGFGHKLCNQLSNLVQHLPSHSLVIEVEVELVIHGSEDDGPGCTRNLFLNVPEFNPVKSLRLNNTNRKDLHSQRPLLRPYWLNCRWLLLLLLLLLNFLLWG